MVSVILIDVQLFHFLNRIIPVKKKDIMASDNLKERSVLETKGIVNSNWLKFD